MALQGYDHTTKKTLPDEVAELNAKPAACAASRPVVPPERDSRTRPEWGLMDMHLGYFVRYGFEHLFDLLDSTDGPGMDPAEWLRVARPILLAFGGHDLSRVTDLEEDDEER